MMGALSLNLGHVYALKNDVRQEAALRDALAISTSDPSLSNIRMVALNNLSDHYLSTGRYRQALEYAKRAEVDSRLLERPNVHATVMTNIGVATAKLGDLAAGIAHVERAVDMAMSLEDQQLQIYLTKDLIALYEDAGRYREALARAHKIAEIKDEVTRQNRETAVLELQEKYSAELKTREIEQLSIENRVKEAEIAARTWQERLWAALAVCMALGGALLLQWLLRARRSNEKLTVVNQALAEQSVNDPLTGALNVAIAGGADDPARSRPVRGPARSGPRRVGGAAAPRHRPFQAHQ